MGFRKLRLTKFFGEGAAAPTLPTPAPGSSVCADQPSQPCKHYRSIGYCKLVTPSEKHARRLVNFVAVVPLQHPRLQMITLPLPLLSLVLQSVLTSPASLVSATRQLAIARLVPSRRHAGRPAASVSELLAPS